MFSSTAVTNFQAFSTVSILTLSSGECGCTMVGPMDTISQFGYLAPMIAHSRPPCVAVILSSFPIDVPVFPVNYDNCHLMNARNEALCRRATGEEG